ncbi:MAG: HD-GYP domain-containing protein [Streptosporangiaceae bacterium]
MTSRAAEQRWIAWQTVDSGRLVLYVVGAVLVLTALARTATDVRLVSVAIGFGLFIAFGELLRLQLPGGREAAPIAMSAALAYAMAYRVELATGPQTMNIPPLQVVAVAALGMTLGALPHVAAGRVPELTGMARRLIAVAFVAFIFHPLIGRGLLAQRWVDFAAMSVMVTLAWLLESVISAVIRADDLRARLPIMIADELRVQWRLGLAVGVSAIITVFGAEVMGIYELVVFAGPLLVIQFAFRRYAGIRATYLQTVRALAQVTEVGGYVASGHARRVSRIALAVGRELGMSEPNLIDLEYAALMHDIGQLSLIEPIPGGATVLVSSADARRIAEFGAEVIRQTGVLDTVAELVRCQWLPARGGPATPPLASRVIRAVNAFDDLVGGSADRDRVAAAIGRLRLDSEAEYDPSVVDALAAVTGRLRLSRL